MLVHHVIVRIGKCQYHLNLFTVVYIWFTWPKLFYNASMHFGIFWHHLFLFCCGFNQSMSALVSVFWVGKFWSCFMNKNDWQQIVSSEEVKRRPWYLQQQQQSSSREQSGLSSPFCNRQWLRFHPNVALFKDEHLRSGENKMQISACLLKLLLCKYSVWMWQDYRINRAPVTQTHFIVLLII